ncbi:Uncharacterised protein [Shigella sonnei]|nr:Uncharacterised protein [Shigella sonnei]
MHLTQRARAFVSGFCGQRAAEYCFGDGTLTPRNHGFKRIGLTVRCRLKLQRHPGRDDPACTSPDIHHRPHQGTFLLRCCPGRVFPDLHWQAVHLQKFRQIAHGIVFENERPDKRSDKPRRTTVAGA